MRYQHHFIALTSSLGSHISSPAEGIVTPSIHGLCCTLCINTTCIKRDAFLPPCTHSPSESSDVPASKAPSTPATCRNATSRMFLATKSNVASTLLPVASTCCRFWQQSRTSFCVLSIKSTKSNLFNFWQQVERSSNKLLSK